MHLIYLLRGVFLHKFNEPRKNMLQLNEGNKIYFERWWCYEGNGQNSEAILFEIIFSMHGGPWSSSSQAFNLVSSEQSHHKPMWLYNRGSNKCRYIVHFVRSYHAIELLLSLTWRMWGTFHWLSAYIQNMFLECQEWA